MGDLVVFGCILHIQYTVEDYIRNTYHDLYILYSTCTFVLLA